MEIHIAGSRPTSRAPKEKFTGTVLQDPIIMAAAPARLNCSR
ncbi:MAG: (R)-mandelonitrile lyase, partial [Bradyrhizobium sp.]